jgi:hypothetical protein
MLTGWREAKAIAAYTSSGIVEAENTVYVPAALMKGATPSFW